MATMTAEPYRAYKPGTSPAPSESVTIVFGGLHWRLERLIQAVLENSGYRARVLLWPRGGPPHRPRGGGASGNAARPRHREPRELPARPSKAIGAQEVAKRLPDRWRRGRACRFGQYRRATSWPSPTRGFRRSGCSSSPRTNWTGSGDGLDLNLPVTLGCLWAIFCADLVQDLEYQVRPYEVEPGRTDAVVQESVDHLYELYEASA